MARRKNPTNLLPPTAATSIADDGRYSDGGGLYLQVRGNSRSWLFKYRWQGGRVEMGLGRAGRRDDEVSLASARALASEARQALDDDRNPLEERRAAVAARLSKSEIPFFGEFADDVVEKRVSSFRNEKHKYQWRQTLGPQYCAVLRKKRIDQISTEDILAVIQPIWGDKQETASRVRGRIEFVLDAAKANGHREGENPARWRGHLDKLLPPRQKLQRGHHAAMPYVDVPRFVADLRSREAVVARACEFLILTASRSGEVREAVWSEIDFDATVWTIPASRMKANAEHRIPLTQAMIEVLETVRPFYKRNGMVFPGQKQDRPLSDMAFKSLFTRMKIEGITAHGFRSSFRDWAGDATSFPREIAEAALAHKVGDEVERAYRRSDALERRRSLMDAWGRYLHGREEKVVSIGRAADIG